MNTNLDVNSYIKGSLTGLHSPSLESKHTNLSEYRSEVGQFYTSIHLQPFPPFFCLLKPLSTPSFKKKSMKKLVLNDYFIRVLSMINSNTLFYGHLCLPYMGSKLYEFSCETVPVQKKGFNLVYIV